MVLFLFCQQLCTPKFFIYKIKYFKTLKIQSSLKTLNDKNKTIANLIKKLITLNFCSSAYLYLNGYINAVSALHASVNRT